MIGNNCGVLFFKKFFFSFSQGQEQRERVKKKYGFDVRQAQLEPRPLAKLQVPPKSPSLSCGSKCF